MIFYRKLFAICIISISALGCTTNNPTPNTIKINVIKQFQLSEETQSYLNKIYPVAVSNPYSEEIAFSNSNPPYRIIITNYSGEYVTHLGKYGRGPDEIQSARFFGFQDSNSVAILDKALASLKIYNSSEDGVLSIPFDSESGISISFNELSNCDRNWYLAIKQIGQKPSKDAPIIGVYNEKFQLIHSFGSYDSTIEDKIDVLQDPIIKVNCTSNQILATHRKIPFIQVYSMSDNTLLNRSNVIPESFKLSEKTFEFVSSPREMNKFLAEEQSVSMLLGYTNTLVYHVFRNMHPNVTQNSFRFDEYDHFVAVYDRETMEYFGEAKLPGAVLGSTKEGYLIVLSNEETYEIQLLEIFKADTIKVVE